MELHYDRPAEYWDQALPIGNGRLGAMVFGTVGRERLQLNEEGLWSGGPQDRINPDCLKNLPKIRDLYRQGRIDEAQRLAVTAMSGTPYTQRAYQTLGEMRMDFAGGEWDGYSRGLDLDGAIAWVRYEAGGVRYERRYFASKPAGCVAARLTARGGTMSFTCRLDRNRHMGFSGRTDGRAVVCGGDQGGIAWAAGVRVMACDGAAETVGDHIVVSGATDVTLVLTAFTQIGGDAGECGDRTDRELREICRRWRDFDEMYEAHFRDYRELYDRVSLTLKGGGEFEGECTDLRLRRFAEGREDPGLAALYFQYGRYLMISGSRPGGLPLTLQGLWNGEFMPPWDSKYTININLEMNYWPVDICGLSECAEPYFSLLRRVCESGRETAGRMYGCGGFVAHHNTDIHADTAPQDLYVPATYWVMGGAWLALAIWEHWLFTGNREFLKKNFYVLEEAVRFFRDFLVENDRGQLVTLPSVSPENSYVKDGRRLWMCEMPAMDIEILTALLGSYIAASEVLGSGELRDEAWEMLKRLPPLKVGSDGRLMEWGEEYEEAEPGHRHISHLFGLFPGSQITLEDTPELALAARRSLEHRLAHGGGHTGWSRAWIVLFWARLGEGGRACGDLRELLAGSTFENLMDSHPSKGRERGRVFQIDGNMGGITGIAEMLVQSHNGRIRVLPALPPQWPAGSVGGLRVRGNGEISMSWEEGELREFTLLAHGPMETIVQYGGRSADVSLPAGGTWHWPGKE